MADTTGLSGVGGPSPSTDFWDLIGTNRIGDDADVAAALAGVKARLEQLDPEGVGRFLRELRARVEFLDLEALWSMRVWTPQTGRIPQSEDGFLYARHACVLAGRRTYEGVLRDAERFSAFVQPSAHSAECLAYLADEVHEQMTGRTIDAV